MKKIHIAILVGGTFLLGIIIGAFVTWQMWDHFTGRFTAVTAGAGTGLDVTTLQWIRTGDTNHAIELLEINLDGEIVALGNSLESVSPSHRDPTLIAVLQKARDYRAKYPRKSDVPEGEILIKRAFDLVSNQTH